MTGVFTVLTLITYFSICYQDFKVREVYLLTYVVMYGLLAITQIEKQGVINVDYIIINSCVLIVVVSMLLIYYLVRYGQGLLLKIKTSIGWGDILMLPAFVISFSPANMILVFNISLLLALIYHVVSKCCLVSIKTIPLAGIQSLVLAFLIMADSLGLINMQADFLTLF